LITTLIKKTYLYLGVYKLLTICICNYLMNFLKLRTCRFLFL